MIRLVEIALVCIRGLIIFKFVIPNPASSGERSAFGHATKKQIPHIKLFGMTGFERANIGAVCGAQMAGKACGC
jgi:hypothetical protein